MAEETGEDLWNIQFSDIELDEKREIGRGQFGAVYAGSLFGSDVAVKKLLRLDQADAKYLKREQDVLRQLSHPNIVQFIGLTASDGFLWLISEFVANGNLTKLVYGTEPLAWSRRVHFALDAVQAIAFIHSKSLMHRDIKCENLLLDSNDKVKLCDFGFARKVDKKLEKLQNKKAAPMTIAGTDEWMAPEVIVGTPYGQPADVFSFGVTLTEMILRKKPEERHPRNAFDFEIEEFRTALPSDCPVEFSALVIECCKYEPASRPEAKLIVRGLKELYQVVKTREGVAKPVTPPSSAVPPPAAPAAAAAAAAAVATPALSPASLEGDSGTSKPKQLRSSSNASGAPPSPRKQVGNGPYVGLTANEHDEASSSASPNENGLFRNVVLSSAMLTKEGRLRWVQFQDAHPSQCEGFLKLAFGETAKPSKYYAVLMLDVLYYFKSNKKGEKNIGRLLLDHKLQVAIQDVGGKKFELRIKTGTEEVIRCVLGSMDELKTWNTALLEGVSSSLDVKECFRHQGPSGLTPLTQSESRPSFPVRFSGSPLTLLLCVDSSGVRLLHAYLEETLLELPWACVQQWQISRNEVLQLYVAVTSSKKPLEMDFSCLAWVTASRVFDALESFSRDSRVVSPAPVKTPLSPRASVDGKGKRGSVVTKK